jgi:glycosyltransferase involved in cell wall biosynthesis
MLSFAAEAAFTVREVMRKHNISVVYGYGPPIPVTMSIVREDKTPLVLDLSEDCLPRANADGKDYITKSYGVVSERILLSCMQRTPGQVIVLTDTMKNFVMRMMSNKRIEVAYDGTDPDTFRPIDPELKRGPKVVFTGDIDVRDGVDVLIKAFAGVVREIATAELHIIGEARVHILSRLRRIVRDLHLDKNVVFTGWVPFSELVEILPTFSVGVVPYAPSLVNSLVIPRKTFEYMAACVPVVSSNLKVMREIVEDGVSGVLFKAGDEMALSESLLRLLTDTELLRFVGQNGRRLSQRYSVRAEVSKIERIMRTYLD